MRFFPFLKKKQYFTASEQDRLVEAIRIAEQQTSGEIRLFIESKNPLVSTIDRAAEIFFKLQMDKTAHRNGVLIYLATTHHEIALFADEGIYNAVGQAYWDAEIKEMLVRFKEQKVCDGVLHCILHVGQTLKEKFPYISSEDKNELPDNIVFGK
ncbi:MAG: TPM domain-containing protein [Chitinophagaceae bacterium]|nr:TPM domain-containing protein [Chitinophagaceae bacterium]